MASLKLCWQMIAAALMLTVGVADGATTDDTITFASFDKRVLQGEYDAVFIRFFTSKREDAETAGAWEEVGDLFSKEARVLIASVDCSDPGGAMVCEAQGVASLPKIMFWTPPDKECSPYEGEHTVEAVATFATELFAIKDCAAAPSDSDSCSGEMHERVKKLYSMELSVVRQTVGEFKGNVDALKEELLKLKKKARGSSPMPAGWADMAESEEKAAADQVKRVEAQISNRHQKFGEQYRIMKAVLLVRDPDVLVEGEMPAIKMPVDQAADKEKPGPTAGGTRRKKKKRGAAKEEV